MTQCFTILAAAALAAAPPRLLARTGPTAFHGGRDMEPTDASGRAAQEAIAEIRPEGDAS